MSVPNFINFTPVTFQEKIICEKVCLYLYEGSASKYFTENGSLPRLLTEGQSVENVGEINGVVMHGDHKSDAKDSGYYAVTSAHHQDGLDGVFASFEVRGNGHELRVGVCLFGSKDIPPDEFLVRVKGVVRSIRRKRRRLLKSRRRRFIRRINRMHVDFTPLGQVTKVIRRASYTVATNGLCGIQVCDIPLFFGLVPAFALSRPWCTVTRSLHTRPMYQQNLFNFVHDMYPIQTSTVRPYKMNYLPEGNNAMMIKTSVLSDYVYFGTAILFNVDNMAVFRYNDRDYAAYKSSEDLSDSAFITLRELTMTERLLYQLRSNGPENLLNCGSSLKGVIPNSDSGDSCDSIIDSEGSNFTWFSGIKSELTEDNIKKGAKFLIRLFGIIGVVYQDSTVIRVVSALLSTDTVSSYLVDGVVKLVVHLKMLWTDFCDSDSHQEFLSMKVGDLKQFLLSILEDWSLIRNNKVFKSLSVLLSSVLAIFCIPTDSLQLNVGDLKLFSLDAYVKQTKSPDLVTAITDTIIFVLEFVSGVRNTSEFKELLKNGDPVETMSTNVDWLYVKLRSFISGDLSTFNTTENEYLMKFDCARKQLDIVNRSPIDGGSRDRLRMANSRFVEIANKVHSNLSSDSPRIQPFFQLVYGEPRIGKTPISDLFVKQAAAAGSFPCTKEYYQTLALDQKHYDGYKNYVTCVKIPEVSQTLPDRCFGEPESRMLMKFGDSEPFKLPMAELELKENAWFKAVSLVANTNNHHLNAPYDVHEPGAVMGRFNIIWQVQVKPDYQKMDGEFHTGAIDDRLLAQDVHERGIPDCWFLTPYKLYYTPKGKPPVLGDIEPENMHIRRSVPYRFAYFLDGENKPVKNLCMADALKFITDVARPYYDRQKVARDFISTDINRCEECQLPIQVCKCGLGVSTNNTLPTYASSREVPESWFNYRPDDDEFSESSMDTENDHNRGFGRGRGVLTDEEVLEAESRLREVSDEEYYEAVFGKTGPFERNRKPPDIVNTKCEDAIELVEDKSAIPRQILTSPTQQDLNEIYPRGQPILDEDHIEPNSFFDRSDIMREPFSYFERYKEDRIGALKQFAENLSHTVTGELVFLGKWLLALSLELLNQSPLFSYKTFVPYRLRYTSFDMFYHYYYSGGISRLRSLSALVLGAGLNVCYPWTGIFTGSIGLWYAAKWMYTKIASTIAGFKFGHVSYLTPLCSFWSIISVHSMLKSSTLSGFGASLLSTVACIGTLSLNIESAKMEDSYRDIDSHEDLKMAIRTATQVGLALRALSMIYKQVQETNRPIIPHAFGVCNKFVPPDLQVNKVSIKRTHDELSNFIVNNIVVYRVGKRTGSIFVLDSTCYLMARHAYEDLPNGTVMEFVRLRYADNTTSQFRCRLEKDLSIKLKNRDLVLVPFCGVKAMGKFKDVTSAFPNSNPLGGPAETISKMPDGEVRRFGISSYTFGTQTNGATDFDDSAYLMHGCVAFPGLFYHSVGYPGMCISPVVDYNSRACVVGFHIGGPKGSTRLAPKHGNCVAVTLLKDEILTAMSTLKSLTRMVHHDAKDPMHDVPDDMVSNRRSTSVIPNDCNELAYMGSVNGYQKFHTSLRYTPYAADIYNIFSLKTQWTPPKFGGPNDNDFKWPWKNGISSYEKMSCGFPYKHLIEAGKDLMADLRNKANELKLTLKPLDDFDVVNGNTEPYVDRMDMSTSSGFPTLGPKSRMLDDTGNNFKPEVWDKVRQMEEAYSDGVLWRTKFWVFAKDEAHESTVTKVRLIQGVELPFSLLVRKYFLRFVSFLQMNTECSECAVGISAQSAEWNQLYEYITEFGTTRILAGDYKKYDRTMPNQIPLYLAGLIHEFLLDYGYTEREANISRALLYDIFNPAVILNGNILSVFGSTPSGHNMTSPMNSLINSTLLRMYYYSLGYKGRFKDDVKLITYGDDFVAGVRKGVHLGLNGFCLYLASGGMVVTDAQKRDVFPDYINIRDVDFLKRKFRYDDVFKREVGPLALNSIFKRLVITKSVDDSTSAQNIAGAILEFAFYGQRVYEQSQTKLISMSQEYNIDHLLPEFAHKDYNEFVEWFDGPRDRDLKLLYSLK